VSGWLGREGGVVNQGKDGSKRISGAKAVCLALRSVREVASDKLDAMQWVTGGNQESIVFIGYVIAGVIVVHNHGLTHAHGSKATTLTDKSGTYMAIRNERRNTPLVQVSRQAI
jgi:hypothetical protein